MGQIYDRMLGDLKLKNYAPSTQKNYGSPDVLMGVEAAS